MESPQTPHLPPEQDTAEVGAYAGPSVSLCARLWEYRGPQEKLAELDWGADEAVANLIREVLRDGHGKIAGLRGNVLISHFANPFNALAAAKSLQVRLLTFHRNAETHQMVAAIAVLESDAKDATATPDASLLIEANSAQILVSAGIYEAAKVVPGFQFGVKPARDAGEQSEAFYELLWTDESTYSHVRKTGQGAVVGAGTGTKRYEIQSELGRGAMGVVYKAVDNVIGRTVALKTISIQRNFADHNELVERLKLEAKAAGSLDHPNIITIYDVGQDEEFVYLSMQFVAGKTLAKVIEEGKLPPPGTLLSYVDQICNAVGFAHQRGVIHRDLKPANFMITEDHTVKVLDFGIAKLGDATVTHTGVVVGTPTYMAPEQAMGKKLDQRSDIFTLGTVFYELFTRERPFKGEVAAVLYKLVNEDPTPPSIINPALPNGIDRIIRKALEKKPDDRYQSCEEMRDAFREQAELLLSAAAATQSVVQQPASASTVQPRPPSSTRVPVVTKRRSSGGAWIGVLSFVLLAGGASGVWAFRVKSQTGSFPAGVQRMIAAAHRAAEAHGLSRRAAGTQSALPHETAGAPPSNPNPGTPSTTTPDNKEALPANSAAANVPATPASDSSTASPNIPAAESPVKSEPSAQQTPPAPGVAKPANVQPVPDDSTTKSSSSAAAEPSDETKTVETSGSKPAKSDAKPASTKVAEENVRVDGFSRSDIPDLLRRADAAAGAGDYSLAQYEYNLVLKLDHHNARARNGLSRVMAAKAEKLPR